MARLVRKKSAPSEDPTLANARRIASIMADTKAIDIRGYDVRGLTLVTDTLVICSAASEPQMKAVFSKVKRGMTDIGVKATHVEGDAGAGWALLDYGDIVVHMFRQEAREFYDLDGLWGDAPTLDLDIED